jgi:hypothetical protein
MDDGHHVGVFMSFQTEKIDTEDPYSSSPECDDGEPRKLERTRILRRHSGQEMCGTLLDCQSPSRSSLRPHGESSWERNEGPIWALTQQRIITKNNFSQRWQR